MSETLSLLSFLDAPVLVGDPQGRAAYVNPAFEERFAVAAPSVTGRPLEELFEGVVRDAMLHAVTHVCERGETLRFQLRNDGVGYAAVASPIVAERARVGVLIVLVENGAADQTLLATHRRMREPLALLTGVLEVLSEQTGGRRAAHYQKRLEEAIEAAETLRSGLGELRDLLSPAILEGGETSFDPHRALSEAAERVRGDLAARGVELALELGESLPRVRGPGLRFEAALESLLRQRATGGAGRLSLTARPLARDGARYVLVSLADVGRAGSGSAFVDPEPELVRQVVRELGGELRSSIDPEHGRTTSIRLAAADPRG